MRNRQAKTVLMAAAVIALAGCGSSAATANSTATVSAPTASAPTAGTSSSAATAAPVAAAGSGSVKAACPSTAEVSSAIGQTYPAAKQISGSGDLTCTYDNSAGNVLVVLFAAAPGSTGADLKVAMDAQAKGQNVTDNAVSGLGDAAYEFSSTTSGTVQTIVDLLAGSEDIDVTSQASVAQTEALAHDILGG
jgi:hypothetical protein